MKKKIISFVAMLLIGSGIANAQLIRRADDNDEGQRSSLFNRTSPQTEYIGGLDRGPGSGGGGGSGGTGGGGEAPLGSAVIPLAVFGTVYLLFRRKSDGSPVE